MVFIEIDRSISNMRIVSPAGATRNLFEASRGHTLQDHDENVVVA